MADFNSAYHKFCPVEVNGCPRVRNSALPPSIFTNRESRRKAAFLFLGFPHILKGFSPSTQTGASLLHLLESICKANSPVFLYISLFNKRIVYGVITQ